MEKLLQKALKQKVRWQSSRGLLTLEDLFSLPHKSSTTNISIDAIHISYTAKRNLTVGESLSSTSNVNETLELQIAILKKIYKLKEKEAMLADIAKQTKELKQDLLAKANKLEKKEILKGSAAELRKKAASLG